MKILRCRGLAEFGPISILSASLLIVGCGSGLAPSVLTNASAITGNWQLSSTDSSASQLPSLSGQFTGLNSKVTGVFHSDSSDACVAPATVIALSGISGADSVVKLTGSLAGGTLTISGTLSADGKTLTGASYNVTGGSCAFSAPAEATAQAYSPVNGSYAGTFTNVTGHTIAFNVDLSQATTPDANGDFPLSGGSTLVNNFCFSGQINISNAMVTGENFTLTYTDTSLGNSVLVQGTLSVDASTLTVTNWVLSGPCNPTSGTGLLTRQ